MTTAGHEDPRAPTERVAGIAATLRGDLEELAAEALERLRDRVAEYGQVIGLQAVIEDSDDGGDVIRDTIGRFLHAVTSGGSREERQEEARAIGFECAAAGLTWEGVSAALHAAASACRHRFLAEGDPVRTETTAELLDAFGDIEVELLGAVETGFRRHGASEEGRRWSTLNAALRRLLEHPVDELGETLRRVASLGADLAPPIAVVALRAHADHADTDVGSDTMAEVVPLLGLDERVERLARGTGMPVLGPVLFEPSPTTPDLAVLLFPACDTRRQDELGGHLASACEVFQLVALHGVAGGLGDLCPTFRRIRAAAYLMEPCAGLLGRVMTLDSVFPYRVASAASYAEQEVLLLETIGPLKTNARSAAAAERHVQTLRVLVEEMGNLAVGAARLNLSVSGLRGRKERIERLTGLSLERDWLVFALALYLYDLWRGRLPGPDDPWWSGP